MRFAFLFFVVTLVGCGSTRDAQPSRDAAALDATSGDGGTDASTDASSVDADELEDSAIDAPLDAPVDAHVMDLAIEDSAIDAPDDARAVDAGDAGAVWLTGAVEVGGTDFVGDVHSVVDASGVLHFVAYCNNDVLAAPTEHRVIYGTVDDEVWHVEQVARNVTVGEWYEAHIALFDGVPYIVYKTFSEHTLHVVVRESEGWRADESFTFPTVADELRPQRLIASDDHLALFYTVGEQSYLTVKASGAWSSPLAENYGWPGYEGTAAFVPAGPHAGLLAHTGSPGMSLDSSVVTLSYADPATRSTVATATVARESELAEIPTSVNVSARALVFDTSGTPCVIYSVFYLCGEYACYALELACASSPAISTASFASTLIDDRWEGGYVVTSVGEGGRSYFVYEDSYPMSGAAIFSFTSASDIQRATLHFGPSPLRLPSQSLGFYVDASTDTATLLFGGALLIFARGPLEF